MSKKQAKTVTGNVREVVYLFGQDSVHRVFELHIDDCSKSMLPKRDRKLVLVFSIADIETMLAEWTHDTYMQSRRKFNAEVLDRAEQNHNARLALIAERHQARVDEELASMMPSKEDS